MSYWDVEMRPWYERLDGLSPVQRMRLAAAALDAAVEALDPPYERAVDAGARRAIDPLRAAARDAAAGGRPGIERAVLEPALERVGDALEDEHRDEAHALLLALTALPDDGGFTVEALAELLDGAYQTAVANAGLAVHGVAIEGASERCRDAIATQQRLIEAAAAG